MSGSSEAGTPQPESGAPADASLLAEVPARGPDGSGGVSDTVPPEATTSEDAPADAARVDAVPRDATATAAVVAAPSVNVSPAVGPHPERDLVLSTGARIIALASVITGAIGLWSQLAFRSPWLDTFLLDNQIDPE